MRMKADIDRIANENNSSKFMDDTTLVILDSNSTFIKQSPFNGDYSTERK
jgi:hypothetical protein